MPKNFSQDGAAGGGFSTSGDAGFGGSTGGLTVSDFGGTSGATPGTFGGSSGGDQASMFAANTGGANLSTVSSGGGGGLLSGFSFEQGGAVPDTSAPDIADEIAQALTSVDSALDFGRKLHGLPTGGEDEQQMAQRMPTVPGNPSESGIPRPQPMPGPLPPTSNPFGKRRMAGLTRMPTTPGNQSESGVPRPLPMPGPLPPTSNPFGKRGTTASNSDSDGDEGGAIPEDDTTGGIDMTGGESGEGFVPGQGQQPAPAPQEQPVDNGNDEDAHPYAPHNMLRQGAKKVIGYLLGQGAADPQTAQKFAQGVKHEYPNVSDDDANLLAVQRAGQMGGPGAAWAMVQYNRQAYNAKQSFARAALNGVDGKAGDIQAAAQAATQAGAHILDGSQAMFTATPTGVTATVKMPGTSSVVNFQLTPEQFNKWLDVGKDGMWDKVMEGGGVAASLQRLSREQGDQGEATSTQAPASVTAPSQNNYGQTPSTMDLSGGQPMRQPSPDDDTNYGSEMEARGRARFPWISQGGQRQEWMAQQEEKEAEREAKIKAAQLGGESRVGAAQARATGQSEAAKERSQGTVEAAKERARGGVEAQTIRSKSYENVADKNAQQGREKRAQDAEIARMREQNHNFRAELGNPNQLQQTPEQQQEIRNRYGINGPSSAPAPAPTQAAPSGGQAYPPAHKRQVGDVVTTEKGTFRWTGTGWVPK